MSGGGRVEVGGLRESGKEWDCTTVLSVSGFEIVVALVVVLVRVFVLVLVPALGRRFVGGGIGVGVWAVE